MKQKKQRTLILEICMWILTLLILLPVWFVVINSFKTKKEAAMLKLTLPTEWQIEKNYTEMARIGRIFGAFSNSVILTAATVALIVLCASTLGFIIERRSSRLSRTINMFIMTGLVLPVQIIPTFFMCHTMGLDNRIAYILVSVAVNLSLCTFLYVGYYKSLPKEIDESACIDGAGPLTTLFRIIFPLTRPVTITTIVLSFMGVWNDFGISIYFLNNVRMQTLPLTVYNFFGSHSSDWQLVFANVVVACIPVLALYLFLQQYIIDGMVAGAVKG